MGLSASQARYLSLTARKSDLEYQAQVINQERMNLANKSADANRFYVEAMSNQIIRIANGYEQGTGLKTWTELTFDNAVEQGYQIIGGGGESLIPSPYLEYAEGTALTEAEYNALSPSEQLKCAYSNGTYTATALVRGKVDEDYKGIGIQSLLVSGRGQIVSNSFFQFLCEHGYGSGKYYSIDNNENRVETTYEKLVEEFENTHKGENTVVDWRSDVSNMFKQVLYTEDDAQALAVYESATSEVQAQDKQLELKLKQIETEHKAIDTEMESVKKVLDKNIENSYKTFG